MGLMFRCTPLKLSFHGVGYATRESSHPNFIWIGLDLTWVRQSPRHLLLCAWFHSSDFIDQIWMDGLCNWHLCCIAHFGFLNHAVCRELTRSEASLVCREGDKELLGLVIPFQKCWHVFTYIIFNTCHMLHSLLYY